jgi:alkanesulfonate monooxygenase SsuD/methylene tetrahydromethanopterin reductase-like flavin-dependent oxidoreductase (luciferase family)
MEIGLGLWSMRATAARPASHAALYAALLDDAQLAEALGFHSLWIAEHHFWYDGWCPSPLTAAAGALGVTASMHIGTGILQLPMHDAARVANAAESLNGMSGGRLELGIGLGYRDAEFDGFGIARRDRGRRMTEAVAAMAERWDSTLRAGGPSVWVGGLTRAALGRAARAGFGVLLPTTLRLDQVAPIVENLREEAEAAGRPMGRVGVIKHAWCTDGSTVERLRASQAIAESISEYTAAWFWDGTRSWLELPERLHEQVGRAVDTAFIGTADQLVTQVRELGEAGVDFVVLQVTVDGCIVDHRATMRAIGEFVLPSFAEPTS